MFQENTQKESKDRWKYRDKKGSMGSLLPPFLLLFAGHVAPIEHRWNQHGLRGDNVREVAQIYSTPILLFYWSDLGKPWEKFNWNLTFS